MRRLSAHFRTAAAAVRVSAGPVSQHRATVLRVRGAFRTFASSSEVTRGPRIVKGDYDLAFTTVARTRTIEAAAAAQAAAVDSWLSVLPSGKRAKLEVELKAAATSRERLDVVRRSVEGDTAKARETARRELLQRILRLVHVNEEEEEEEEGDVAPSSHANGGGESAAAATSSSSVDFGRFKEEVLLTMTRFGRLAKMRRQQEVDRAELQKYSDAAVNLSDSWNLHQTNLILSALGKLANEGGVEVDHGAVQVLAKKTARSMDWIKLKEAHTMLYAFGNLACAGVEVDPGAVSSLIEMLKRSLRTCPPQAFSKILFAFAKVAAGGMYVDPDAVRAYVAAAREASHSMNYTQIGSMMSALGALASGGIAVDDSAVKAITDAARLFTEGEECTEGDINQRRIMLVWHEQMARGGLAVDLGAVRASAEVALRRIDRMYPGRVYSTAVAFASLAELGILDVDPAAVRALSDAVARVAEDIRFDWQLAEMVSALEKLKELSGVARRDDDGHLAVTAAAAQTRTRTTEAAAAVDSWLSVLPSGKRAKLEVELKAAATSRERLDVVRRSVEGDTAKARETARRELVLLLNEIEVISLVE